MTCHYVYHSQYHPQTGKVHVTCTTGADHYHILAVPHHIPYNQKQRYIKALFKRKDRTDELSSMGRAKLKRRKRYEMRVLQ